jgi:hypothetical protein
MFEGHKPTGTGYTRTAALVVVAFVFSPAALFFTRPLGYLSVSLAIACSVICIALARFNWKRNSQLSMPSIAIQKSADK